MSIESKAESWGLSWVVVTGASQGLGASICQGLAGRLAAGSRILGLARSAQGLQDTAEKVQRINPDIKVSKTYVRSILYRIHIYGFICFSDFRYIVFIMIN